MTRLLSAAAGLALLAGALPAVADPIPPPVAVDAKVARLIADLGREDFAEREAAEAALDALGATALDPLRTACQSPSPEVARRARELVARIGRRVDNEAALAPTLVELTAEKTALGDVLADLSRQSGYAVVLDGPNADEIRLDRVTVKTGQLPFWRAVVAVCDAADLEITSVGGVTAPNVRPVPRPAGPNSILLEARGTRPKRPTAVYGAVLVEAFDIPAAAGTADTAVAVLQLWPEPKLNWTATTGVRVKRAADAAGQLLAARPDAPAAVAPQVVARGNVVIVKNVNGGVVLVNTRSTVPTAPVAAFTPNARQAVVSLKPGAKPAATLTELAGVVTGTVRSGTEPMIQLTGLKAGTPATGSHPAGVDLKARVSQSADGKWKAEVELMYDSKVLPAGESAPRSGRQAGRADPHVALVGVRVTDGAGSLYTLSTSQIRCVPGPAGTSVRYLTLELVRPSAGAGDPDTVTFSGIYSKPVEVPFALAGVPLTVGAK